MYRGIGSKAGKEVLTDCGAHLTIFRAVRMDTLASLLKFPVEWESKLYPSIIHPITGIDQMDFEGDGALVGVLAVDGGYLFRNLTFNFEVRMEGLTRLDGFAETVRQLVHFVPVLPKDCPQKLHRTGYPTMSIRESGEEELDTWLANVSVTHHLWSFSNLSLSGPHIPSPRTETLHAYYRPG
jgi:hypothetical protein